MKRFALMTMCCMALLPFSLQAANSIRVSSANNRPALNFYVANNFSLSVMPGVRLQQASVGLDGNVAFDRSGFTHANLNALYYFNPGAKTQHYLSLGGALFAGERVNSIDLPSGSEAFVSFSRVLPSLAYGFQRGFSEGNYLFMNFGFCGPVNMEIHGDESLNAYRIPLPFMHIGYAF